jgi:hypothetical protein
MNMKTVLGAALALALLISPAVAMTAAQVPTKFQIPWAADAGGGFTRAIPQASQIGIQNGAASLTDGFPPLTFLPVGSGGVPPFGQDFNGILNEITAWQVWQGAGGVVAYDGTFSAAIGGYPKGAVIAGSTAGSIYLSTVDNNTSNPNSGGANWVNLTAPFVGDSGSGGTAGVVPSPPAGSTAAGYFLSASGSFAAAVPTAQVNQFLSSTCPAGNVEANGGTIGDAASGGTLIASAAAQALFTNNWLLSASVAPIQTSAGAPSTRGVSAAADFAAHKRIVVPDMRGTFPRSLDDGRGIDSGRVLGAQQAFSTSVSDVTATSTFAGTALPAITFPIDAQTINLVGNSGSTPIWINGSGKTTTATSPGTPAGSVTTGLSGSTETRPVNVALLSCIKL